MTQTKNSQNIVIGLASDDAYASETTASFGGIIAKTSVMVFAALILLTYMIATIANNGGIVESYYEYQRVAVAAGIISFVSMIMLIFTKSRVFIVSYVIGFSLTVTAFAGLAEYFFPGIAFQAVILTFGVVVGLLLMYAFAGLRSTNAVFKVAMSLFFSIMMFLMIALIMSIFGADFLLAGFDAMYGFILAIYLVMAAGMLVRDFELASETVESGAPKKAEWVVAAGLYFSIIYMFYIILNILVRIAASSRD